MGRHAAPAPAPEPDGKPVPQAEPEQQRATARGWWDHVILAVVAALAVGGVTAWVGAGWRTALLGALAAAVVVLAAAWTASRLPHHGPVRSD